MVRISVDSLCYNCRRGMTLISMLQFTIQHKYMNIYTGTCMLPIIVLVTSSVHIFYLVFNTTL